MYAILLSIKLEEEQSCDIFEKYSVSQLLVLFIVACELLL